MTNKEKDDFIRRAVSNITLSAGAVVVSQNVVDIERQKVNMAMWLAIFEGVLLPICEVEV